MSRREGLKLDPEINGLFSRPYVDPPEMTFAGHNTSRLQFHEQRADGVSRPYPRYVRELRRFAAYNPENQIAYLLLGGGTPGAKPDAGRKCIRMGSVSGPGIPPLNR